MLTTKSEDRQIRSVWQNKRETQTMTSSNECTYEHTILSAWNEREQSYASYQLSDRQNSRLNTTLYQWKVLLRRFKKQERQNVWWLQQILDRLFLF